MQDIGRISAIRDALNPQTAIHADAVRPSAK